MMKNVKMLKENLSDVLYSLQHLNVNGVDLSTQLKIDGFVSMSKQEDLEDAHDLNVAYNLSQALVSITQGIKTPRNSGVSGAIYQANKGQNAKVKKK